MVNVEEVLTLNCSLVTFVIFATITGRDRPGVFVFKLAVSSLLVVVDRHDKLLLGDAFRTLINNTIVSGLKSSVIGASPILLVFLLFFLIFLFLSLFARLPGIQPAPFGIGFECGHLKALIFFLALALHFEVLRIVLICHALAVLCQPNNWQLDGKGFLRLVKLCATIIGVTLVLKVKIKVVEAIDSKD